MSAASKQDILDDVNNPQVARKILEERGFVVSDPRKKEKPAPPSPPEIPEDVTSSQLQKILSDHNDSIVKYQDEIVEYNREDSDRSESDRRNSQRLGEFEKELTDLLGDKEGKDMYSKVFDDLDAFYMKGGNLDTAIDKVKKMHDITDDGKGSSKDGAVTPEKEDKPLLSLSSSDEGAQGELTTVKSQNTREIAEYNLAQMEQDGKTEGLKALME